MALTNEDKKDVQGAMGKAIANKVSKVTRDRVYKTALGAVKSKSPNAMNMNFSVDDIKGQKKVSDANKRYSAKSKALQGKGIHQMGLKDEPRHKRLDGTEVKY